MTTQFTNTFKAPWILNANESFDLPGEIDIESVAYLRIYRKLEIEYREWGIKSIYNTAKVAHVSIELTVDACELDQDDITLLINRGFSQISDSFTLDVDASDYDVICEYEGVETPNDAEIDLLNKKITLS